MMKIEFDDREDFLKYLRGLSQKQFEEYTVAQDDDCDYSESGYVVLKVDGWAFMSGYSHCSCYGTYDVFYDNLYNETGTLHTGAGSFVGKWSDLVEMAKRTADPAMPEREADPEDYDHDHLVKTYAQVLEHEAKVA